MNAALEALPLLTPAFWTFEAKAQFGYFLLVSQRPDGTLHIETLPLEEAPACAKSFATAHPTGEGIVFLREGFDPFRTSIGQVGRFAHWSAQAEIARKALVQIVGET